jgi:hypothetical protein
MIDELDAKIAEYYSLSQLRYTVMKSCNLTQGFDQIKGEMQQHLSIILCKDDTFTGEMLYLEFIGVRNFRFEQPSMSLVNLDLEITKASPGQKFDCSIAVTNAEQDVTLVCSCHDFIAAIA